MARRDAPVARTGRRDRPQECLLVGVVQVAEPGCGVVAARLADSLAPQLRRRWRSSGADAVPAGVVALSKDAFRPRVPFRGPLFAALESFALAARLRPPAAPARRSVVGLVVPALPTRHADMADVVGVLVTDHVDLTLRGPLFGRWPAGRPRTFPSMSDLYAPDLTAALVTARGCGRPDGLVAPAPSSSVVAEERHPSPASTPREPAVYSRSVVAGVADVRHLSAWEGRQVRDAGLSWVADCLVAPAIVAAYHGFVVAAVGVPLGA